MKGKAKLLTAMLIWGSLGLFVKNINLPSSEIALFRGVIGSIFLLGASLLIKQKKSYGAIKENAVLLILSGAALGFNWILLFEAYRYTTISNATLSYYFAPIFVMVLAPFILKEKLRLFNVISIAAAMLGLFLVNMGGASGGASGNHTIGILYGLSAAALYASVVLFNKFIKNLPGFETTMIQLLIAVIVLFPYVLLKDNLDFSSLNVRSIVFMVIVGIIHTGFAYFLYFTSIKDLKGQTIALLSYLDPISAVIFAAIFLSESMNMVQIIGGILILGSTYLSDRMEMRVKKAA
ncbi:DMT family transporter [Neobacillus mesonae]|uniref:DMT family transporter n=1 Tax=Neobacillus mesonae TaxID=1193713 RepID=UPI00204005AB|nr:DMT family transporter [Neobacillus mesonae]MCM3568613.1 DMT family transporter [Neobacillus mesonae]